MHSDFEDTQPLTSKNPGHDVNVSQQLIKTSEPDEEDVLSIAHKYVYIYTTSLTRLHA